MSIVRAKEIISRLRSGGVKVFLKNGAVTFSSLDNVAPALKHEITSHGMFLHTVLAEEEEVRATRQKLRKRREPITNTNSEDL